ncbi:MAG: class I SAM-dependent methyltransferase [Actinomycetota bacterium]|nr:class I SAM-dependent methyltransferase [Actinomycetota bacterium]
MMKPVEGAATFQKSGADYDAFMGRYSQSLAPAFADWAKVTAGQSALDVGCGPGALTSVLAERLGPGAVLACDPSEPFLEECRARHPDVEVRRGRAEELPCEDASRDLVLAQLVLHFVSDPEAAAREMRRVLRPGGTVAACSWDFAQGMEMLRHFWDAAVSLDPVAPDEAALRFGREGELAELFADAGFEQTTESTLEVVSSYASYDELWSGFLTGIGPAGNHAVRQPREKQDALRQALFEEVGSPEGPFELRAVARAGRGMAPDA